MGFNSAFKGLIEFPRFLKNCTLQNPSLLGQLATFFKHCNQRLIKDGINMYCSTFKKFTGLWKFGHAIHMMWLLWKLFPVWLYMSYTGVSNFLKICQKMVCPKEIHQHFFVVLWVVCDGLHNHISKWCVIFGAAWLSQHWMPSPIWQHILIHTNTHQLVFGC